MANNPRQVERERDKADSDQHPGKAGEKAGEAVRGMGDAAERLSRASAETLQRNAESASGAWLSGAEAAGRIAQRSIEHLSQVLGLGGETLKETLQRSSSNMQAVMESTTVLAGGFQDVTGEWMRFAESRMAENLDHLDRLAACRNPHDLVALQTELMRNNLEALLKSAQRTSERTTHIAQTAVERMSSPPVAPR